MPDKRIYYEETRFGEYSIRIVKARGKKHQKLERSRHNPEKVVLTKIGDLEVYCYPYRFPDKVFIGKFPISTGLDVQDLSCLLRAYNRGKSFLEANFTDEKSHKPYKYRRKIRRRTFNLRLAQAYNYGLKRFFASEKDRKRKLNLEYSGGEDGRSK